MKWLAVALICGLSLLPSVLKADDYTLELGAGLAAGRIPVYPGSADDYEFLLPFPYIYYRDDKITLDNQAFKGRLFRQGKFELSLSASGQLPVKEGKSKARDGLPELGWVGGIGLKLDYQLTDDDSTLAQWRLHKSTAWSEGKFSDVGWLSDISVRFDRDLTLQPIKGNVEITAEVGAVFASSQYQQYYYGVSPEFATVERPAYSARPGFSHLSLSLGLIWRHKNWWVGAYTKYLGLNDASNTASPLLEETDQINIGLAVSRILWTNK